MLFAYSLGCKVAFIIFQNFLITYKKLFKDFCKKLFKDFCTSNKQEKHHQIVTPQRRKKLISFTVIFFVHMHIAIMLLS